MPSRPPPVIPNAALLLWRQLQLYPRRIVTSEPNTYKARADFNDYHVLLGADARRGAKGRRDGARRGMGSCWRRRLAPPNADYGPVGAGGARAGGHVGLSGRSDENAVVLSLVGDDRFGQMGMSCRVAHGGGMGEQALGAPHRPLLTVIRNLSGVCIMLISDHCPDNARLTPGCTFVHRRIVPPCQLHVLKYRALTHPV